jgi:signal transduction histidine kinase
MLTTKYNGTEAPLQRTSMLREVNENSNQPMSGDRKKTGLAGWLLAFSRRPRRRLRHVDLNALILLLRNHLRAILPENIQLQLGLEPLLDSVIADENALQEALIHLVVNARDAMPEGGKLTIETALARRTDAENAEPALQNGVLVRVRDTGARRDAAVETSTSQSAANPENAAAGLGLSAVYEIVTQAGGQLSVTAHDDAGTTVEILLPSANDE